MLWLRRRTNDGRDPITREELADYRYRGEKVRLISTQQGIWKPAFLDRALAIVTPYSRPGADRPYDDSVGADTFYRYKWRKRNSWEESFGHSENVGLRRAGEDRVPLIWYWGVAPGVFQPIFPVYIRDEEPEEHQFVVEVGRLLSLDEVDMPRGEVPKEYRRTLVDKRVHQPVFRGLVMQAYQTRCAVCALGHSELLDAAHIVPDREEGGIAAVRNGLALCKIHHAAYDAGILGVTPDRTVAIREDILEEVDGPVLEYGLKRLNGQKLRVIPRARKDRPDRELLDRQYRQFMSARTGRIDELWAPERNGQRMDVRHEHS